MVKRKRKSPIRHNVKSHVRAGYRVSNYVRGKGTRTIPTLTSRRKLIKTDEPKAYTCNFKYSEKKGDGESVIVIATNYHKALDEAFEERADSREPIEVEVIHPDIGRMLKILGRGAKVVGREAVQLSKLGIKYSYKGAKVLGYEAARAVAIKYGKLKVKRLIEDAYSPDRPTRVFARAKLRTKYPEIYAVCDFSREGPRKRWTRAGRETIR